MRSKTLLISNIIATIYSAMLLWTFGGAIIAAGGLKYIEYLGEYFTIIFELLKYSVTSEIILTIVILLLIHIATLVIGALFGWIGYVSKKYGFALFGAILYLIGTICFPIYIFFGLPITILGFVGQKNQKNALKQ